MNDYVLADELVFSDGGEFDIPAGDKFSKILNNSFCLTEEQFGTIFANSLPGFFPLSSEPVTLEDPLAQEFVSWREKCKSTIRSTYQILSRGTPNLENDTWVESANVINGTDTPEVAAKKLQDGLDSWYKPAK